MMFFKNRLVPPYPISLVKLAARTASLINGFGSSTPMSDHVPELR